LRLPAQRAKIKSVQQKGIAMGQCREGKSEVPFAQATQKCGKCGARTAKHGRVCQPQPLNPTPPPEPAEPDKP
jgi:hypothetical protein